jgi:hypothetical protein
MELDQETLRHRLRNVRLLALRDTQQHCAVCDFGSKVVSERRQRYRSATSALLENLALETVVADLSGISESLTSHVSEQPGVRTRQIWSQSREDKVLWELAARCKELADELLDILEDLKVMVPHRRWESCQQAFRSMVKRERIRDMEKRLEQIRAQLNIQLAAMMEYVTMPKARVALTVSSVFGTRPSSRP